MAVKLSRPFTPFSALFQGSRQLPERAGIARKNGYRLVAALPGHRHPRLEETAGEMDIESVGCDSAIDGAANIIDLILPKPGDFTVLDLQIRCRVQAEIILVVAAYILAEAANIRARNIGYDALE
jgi:hypothetical protein